MRQITTFAALACSLLLGGQAMAQNLTMSTYLGASGGVASWNADCGGASSCSKNPGSYRLYAGYNVNRNLALELTYASLGKVTASGPTTLGLADADMQAKSYDLAVVYKLGAPDGLGLGGFVKGGLAYTQAKSSARVGGLAVSASSKNAWGLVLGGGLTYAFTPNLAVRAEVDTQKVDVGGGTSGNVTSVSVGGQVAF